MNEQAYRTIGAVIGLSVGYAAMRVYGVSGMVASALFWGAGCVLGGMIAERVYRWRRNQRR